MKHLRRSDDNSIIAGVMGGLGEYFKVDPALLRVLFVFLVLVTGVVPGVIAYIIAIFIYI